MRRQRPSAFVRVRAECGPTSTVTARPGAAQPQTGRGWSRCRTMWSVKMQAIRNAGCDSARCEVWHWAAPHSKAATNGGQDCVSECVVGHASRNSWEFSFGVGSCPSPYCRSSSWLSGTLRAGRHTSGWPLAAASKTSNDHSSIQNLVHLSSEFLEFDP